jgi:hypothetical protein
LVGDLSKSFGELLKQLLLEVRSHLGVVSGTLTKNILSIRTLTSTCLLVNDIEDWVVVLSPFEDFLEELLKECLYILTLSFISQDNLVSTSHSSRNSTATSGCLVGGIKLKSSIVAEETDSIHSGKPSYGNDQ